MPNRAAALLAVLLFGLVACSQSEPLRVGVSAAPVIYGEDDRTEVYAVADPDLRGRAMASAVGIGFRDEFVTVEGETVTVRAGNLAGAANLCSDQTFAGQPSAARCSGLLVEADLVLTAGHCARMIPCDQMLLVLGYYYRAEGELSALTRNDLYACHEVIAKELSPPTSPERLDYAWIRLDHEVRGFDAAPIEVRDRAAPLEAGEPLTMFGFPSGLPLKVDQGGTVVDPRDDTLDYFVASTDSFYGSSGSPIFDASGFLVGVQNRGAPDYVETGAGCNALSRRSEEAGQVEEQATYAARAVDGLCAEDRGQRLCGGQALAPGAACAVRGAGAGANSSRHPTASLALVVLGLVWRRRRGGRLGRQARPRRVRRQIRDGTRARPARVHVAHTGRRRGSLRWRDLFLGRRLLPGGHPDRLQREVAGVPDRGPCPREPSCGPKASARTERRHHAIICCFLRPTLVPLSPFRRRVLVAGSSELHGRGACNLAGRSSRRRRSHRWGSACRSQGGGSLVRNSGIDRYELAGSRLVPRAVHDVTLRPSTQDARRSASSGDRSPEFHPGPGPAHSRVDRRARAGGKRRRRSP
jgi:hypothetical protein